MSTQQRTLLDAEKIRSLMIELQVKLDRSKHTEVGQQVLSTPMIKEKIRHIAIHNTSSDYLTVKGWVDELNRFL